MNIYVDESGTFRTSPKVDSWCTVVAYVSPEPDRGPLERLVRALRTDCANGAEAKLGDITESRYMRFLRDLSRLDGIALAVAADAHLHTDESIRAHQTGQAHKVTEHIDKMRHPEGRIGLQALADAIRSLPTQLYAQLICQVELFHKVITRAITYYAQRQAPTLGHLRWRVDRKDTIPTAYESASRRILPALLQTKSLREPILMLTESADYSFFKRFEYAAGEAPAYLRDDYGIDFGDRLANVGLMVAEDFELVDSAKVPGVQVADLLASGLRRVLRGNFDNPVGVAALIGANMLQEPHHKPPVQLVALGRGNEERTSESLTKVLGAMTRLNRPYLVCM
jgi:hypothetical protein